MSRSWEIHNLKIIKPHLEPKRIFEIATNEQAFRYCFDDVALFLSQRHLTKKSSILTSL